MQQLSSPSHRAIPVQPVYASPISPTSPYGVPFYHHGAQDHQNGHSHDGHAHDGHSHGEEKYHGRGGGIHAQVASYMPFYGNGNISSNKKRGIFGIITTFVRTMVADPKTRSVFFFLCLNLSFTVVEAVYGIWTNSLGLFSDAIHMLFDSTAIIFSLVASVIAKWDANEKFSYGYGRVEVLTGFANSLALFFAGGGIIWEAIERLINPAELDTDRLLLVAVLGFLVNLGMPN